MHAYLHVKSKPLMAECDDNHLKTIVPSPSSSWQLHWFLGVISVCLIINNVMMLTKMNGINSIICSVVNDDICFPLLVIAKQVERLQYVWPANELLVLLLWFLYYFSIFVSFLIVVSWWFSSMLIRYEYEFPEQNHNTSIVVMSFFLHLFFFFFYQHESLYAIHFKSV